MKEILDTNYLVINGWMKTRLGLKGTELLVFSIIYGFTQDGTTEYCGGLSYLMEWTDASKPTIINALKLLCEKKYIERIDNFINGVNHVKYKISEKLTYALVFKDWSYL